MRRIRNDEVIPTRYRGGDVVWVKLNALELWWPGRVATAEDNCYITTKSTPFAVVVFFSEETFEFVSSAKMIYPFHCPRKLDFIELAKNKFQRKPTKQKIIGITNF
ncbi:GH17655 [Drosophila grimshawi]|uniref:GH17655 n=1 Tax=Drosophila grimshawi TaxID=7222 RepID=B4JX19_DROGR|nr:GH17655 [Drosophila grimshawi]